MALDIFQLMRQTNNYELTFYEEPSVSLRAIIAINNTVLGPVLATSKIFDFQDVERATQVALRMAYYNTYRAALLKRQFGGGSIVLCGDPKKVKNEFYLRALGIYLNKFAGKVFVASGPDLTEEDIFYIMRETEFVLGGDELYLRKGLTPAVATAKGIIYGIKAAVKDRFGRDDLSGLTFVVQGIDDVGYNIVNEIISAGDTHIIITDNSYDRIKEIQDKVPEIKVVRPNEIYSQQCDVFISCSFDKSLTKTEAEQLKAKILTGSVNNLVYSEEVEQIIQQKGITYVPGYIINGGEIILFDNEFDGHEPETVMEQLSEIYFVTLDLLRKAKETNKSLDTVAIETAKEYIENISMIKKLR